MSATNDYDEAGVNCTQGINQSLGNPHYSDAKDTDGVSRVTATPISEHQNANQVGARSIRWVWWAGGLALSVTMWWFIIRLF